MDDTKKNLSTRLMQHIEKESIAKSGSTSLERSITRGGKHGVHTGYIRQIIHVVESKCKSGKTHS